jgi:hypothetical protein
MANAWDLEKIDFKMGECQVSDVKGRRIPVYLFANRLFRRIAIQSQRKSRCFKIMCARDFLSRIIWPTRKPNLLSNVGRRSVICCFIFGFIISGCKMNIDKKVKKSLEWGSMIIKLYEGDRKSLLTESFENIEAFDMYGNLLWRVEPPKSKMDFYYDIKIDTVNRILLAYTAVSYLAKIDLESGKILEFHVIN